MAPSARRRPGAARRGLAIALGILALAMTGADGPEPAGQAFGAPVRISEPTPLADVLRAPEAFGDRTILLRGRIADVCQRKGCWTVLQEGEDTLRVRFRDYGFFVPRDIQGREALVEGVVSVRTLSERDARHYEAESARGDPSSIDGPRTEVGFLANGVRLLPRSERGER